MVNRRRAIAAGSVPLDSAGLVAKSLDPMRDVTRLRPAWYRPHHAISLRESRSRLSGSPTRQRASSGISLRILWSAEKADRTGSPCNSATQRHDDRNAAFRRGVESIRLCWSLALRGHPADQADFRERSTAISGAARPRRIGREVFRSCFRTLRGLLNYYYREAV